MADRPVVPPKKNELPLKLHTELDYSEHCRNLPDADHFYDCEEEIDNQQTQNYTMPIPATTNNISEDQGMFSCTFTHSAGAEESSDEQNIGNEWKNLEQSNEEDELSEVLKKLLQYGEEIKACARQCGIDADSFECVTTSECTGTEPCLEPFVGSSENPEPTARGDTECVAEENDAPRSTVPIISSITGEEVWCSACSSPRSFSRPDTPSVIDTIRNLRWDSLEEYFRENSNGLVWPKRSEEDKKKEKAQLLQSRDKKVYNPCMKKSKSDSEVLCSSFQELKSEDEEGYKSDSSSTTSQHGKEQTSTDWSTLSCHTASSISDASINDDQSTTNSMDGTQDDDTYQDDLEGRPDAAGDCGGSSISIHVAGEELDEGIYEIDVDDNVFVTPASGDQDPLDNAVTYNFRFLPENERNNDPPPRLTLATEQMLGELFPNTRPQPRPIRILQSIPDHPVSENTSGGGEGDFELGRRIVVQSFFVENASPVPEVTESASWPRPELDINRDSLRDIIRWSTVAGFCASAFLIWQLHHSFR